MRYSDRRSAITHAEDFLARKRIPTFIQFCGLFGINFLLVLFAWLCTTNMVSFALSVFLILAILNALTVWSVQRTRDMLLVTEFQNALFGAAISLNNTFSLIARTDGRVEYTDRGFAALFPDYGKKSTSRTLEEILQMGSVANDESERLYSAITRPTPAQHIITLRDSNGIAHKLVVTVDPLRRPQDFTLLRARPFIENRA